VISTGMLLYKGTNVRKREKNNRLTINAACSDDRVKLGARKFKEKKLLQK